MSSYFVSSLTTCYQPGVADGGGPDGGQSEYPETASPYRGYHTVGSPQYSYNNTSAPSQQNGDYYMSQRLSHPPLDRDNSDRTPPGTGGGGSMHPAAGSRSHSSSSSSNYSSGNSYNSATTPTRHQSHSEMPETVTPSPPPAHSGSQPTSQASEPTPTPDNNSNQSGSDTQGEGSQQSSPTTQPQIYPWMRRMHVGHGNVLISLPSFALLVVPSFLFAWLVNTPLAAAKMAMLSVRKPASSPNAALRNVSNSL